MKQVVEKPMEVVPSGGLKIKTLEEIKAEKELKKKIQEESSSLASSTDEEKLVVSNEDVKMTEVPQINVANNGTVTSTLEVQDSFESNNEI